MKGGLDAPDGKRPLPPRMGETGGIRLKGRDCEIIAGMKGWRPSACLSPKPVRAFKRAYFCRTSDRSSVFIPGPRAFVPWTPGFPLVRAMRLCGREVGRKCRRSVRDHKTAPALRLHHETGGPETKPGGTTNRPAPTPNVGQRRKLFFPAIRL